ncbi:GNAT family N-acetyltransferase [Fictibacillus halophilus]|uniref:GNAT family N-acetyltransferase n=1 Tax=Fictibacillus halophilus TaxID=1610490 RepID=UPI001CFBA06A|nr:GNAT family N-acetyltransferase [Fictibacillus halophilus]
MKIVKAKNTNLENIVTIDKEMIGTDRRKEEIGEAVEQDRCLLVFDDSELAGFLIYHTSFFDCCFVSLIMIWPSFQRRGHASALLSHMTEISPTEKLFSSTNQSNDAMHKVFEASGFTKSGFIDNLDEGDPEIIYFIEKRFTN